MTDPTTLSIADLAAAVVLLGARRGAGDSRVLVNSAEGRVTVADAVDYDDIDLLLAAANRLPGVVGERDAWQRNANAAKDALHESERRRAADLAEFEEALKAPAAEMAGMLDGVVVAKLATMSEQRDASTRRADVIAEAARSVLALAEPLIAKHSGPYPASVVADLRAVLEQPGLVDSLYAAEVLADGCGRTARLEQERDAALARAAAAEAEVDTCRAKAARAEDAQDTWVRHVLQADERIAAAEADTVARIVHWLRVKSAEQVDRAKLTGWHPDEAGYVDALHDAAEAIESGAWRGKEQA